MAGALALADVGTVPLAVEPDAQPAARRTTTTSPASAVFVARAAERILGSNQRQALLPLSIGHPLSPLQVT
jgi:hypothetical protein